MAFVIATKKYGNSCDNRFPEETTTNELLWWLGFKQMPNISLENLMVNKGKLPI
jgi:hypothetical protein